MHGDWRSNIKLNTFYQSVIYSQSINNNDNNNNNRTNKLNKLFANENGILNNKNGKNKTAFHSTSKNRVTIIQYM